MKACRNHHLVLFDGSIDPRSPASHNYRAMTVELMLLDFALVVSRSHMPLNVEMVHPGGAPIDPEAGGKSNDEIEKWLEAKLSELLTAIPLQLDRYWLGFGKWMEGNAARHANLRKQGQVFLSFHHEKGDPAFLDRLAELKRRIEAGEFHGEPKSVHYFLPGSLSSELMTAQRRWMVAALIRDRLAAAEEIWIYESENYETSWWSQVELLAASNQKRNPGEVKIWSPGQDRVESGAGKLPPLSGKEKWRLARWMANCTPDQMGPERLFVFRIYQQIPLIGRIPYFRDHVWSEEFWDHPILDCPVCRKERRGQGYTVDELLWLRGDHFTRFTPEEFAAALAAGRIRCPRCTTSFAVRESIQPHYLWIPETRKVPEPSRQLLRSWRFVDDWLVALPTYILG
jgi:hypothetical protein